MWPLTVLITELHVLGTFVTFATIKPAYGNRINPVTEIYGTLKVYGQEFTKPRSLLEY
jgi:hypothetical protein